MRRSLARARKRSYGYLRDDANYLWQEPKATEWIFSHGVGDNGGDHMMLYLGTKTKNVTQTGYYGVIGV